MYVLMVGPNLLCTDGMIFEGSKHLLSLSGINVNEYIKISDSTREEINPRAEPSHIIVLGTPWLWDRCWESNKYLNLTSLFKRYPTAKKLFLGIGACYPLHHQKEINELVKTNLPYLADVFAGSTIVVRDILAKDALSPFSPIALPCPAYYALQGDPLEGKAGHTMIWYDPTIGLSQVNFGPNSKMLRDYIQRFLVEYDKKGYKVYCASPLEIPLAQKIGLPPPTVFSSVQEAAIVLRNSKSIFSGRVHLSVPAYRLGIPIELVPVDSRHRVLSDLAYFCSLQEAEVTYVKILTEFIK